MNIEQSQRSNNEIHFVDVIQFIWDGKWLISGFTAVTSIITVICLIVVPQNYTGEIEINPITNSEIFKYNELNKYINGPFIINEKKLENLFFEDLITYKGFEESITKNMYLEKIKNETELEFSRRIKEVAREFTLSKIEQKNSTDVLKQRARWIISTTTQKPDLLHKVMSDALAFSNKKVSMQIKREFDNYIATFNRSIVKGIEDLDDNADSLKKYQKLKDLAKLNFLGEQAAIARTLGLKNISEFFVPREKNLDLALPVFDDDELYFLRGYLSIDKEIEFLSARVSQGQSVNQMILKNELEKEKLIKSKKIIPILRDLFEETPVGTDTFVSVKYDVDSIELKSKTKTLLILILSVTLGGMIGIFVTIIRNLVIRKE